MSAFDEFHKPPNIIGDQPKFVEKAVNSVWFTFLSRLSMMLCGISFVILGWTVNQAWQSYERSQDNINRKLDQISSQATALNDKIQQGVIEFSVLKAQFTNMQTSTDVRFSADEAHLGKLDNDVDLLKQRVYSLHLPQITYPSPEDLSRKKWQK